MVKKAAKKKKSKAKPGTPNKDGKLRKPRDDAMVSEVLDLLRHGYSPEEIAPELKIDISKVRELASRGLAQITRLTTKDNLLLDLQRINLMMSRRFIQASEGDVDAINQVSMLMEKRRITEEKLAAYSETFFDTLNRFKVGRPPHVPTQESRGIVRALAICDRSNAVICEVIGIDDETLTKHYAEELIKPKEKLLALAVRNIHDGVALGDKGYTNLVAKVHGKWKETEEAPPPNPNEPGAAQEAGMVIDVRGTLFPVDEEPAVVAEVPAQQQSTEEL